MWYQVVLYVFSQEQIGRGHVYIEYTQKVLKVLQLSTPKKYFFVRVKCELLIFPGMFFLYGLQTKMVIASGSENNVSSRHSPRHLLPGGEPCFYMYIYIYFLHTSTFQLLDKPWSQVSSLLPPVLSFNFYRA